MLNKNDKDMVEREDGLPEWIDIDRLGSFGGDTSSDTALAKREEKRLFWWMAVALTLVLVFLFLIFIISLGGEGNAPMADDPTPDRLIEDTPPIDNGKDAEVARRDLSVSEIYSRCKDSVVSISTKKGAVTGVGSGFVYSSDGYIATACHVIDGMDEIYVIFSDGRRITANVVGKEASCDIALLKVACSGLKEAEAGDSDGLLVGERVVAIGTPASLDYAGSASSGEVSYLNRVVKIYSDKDGSLEKKMTLLQTNAPLNPGNSGCPLFDSLGNVVGMVTMKLGKDYTGMGFAIPSSGAYRILEAMKKGEELGEDIISAVCVKGARLGVLGEAVSDDKTEGVRITDFAKENCDAAVKLKKGDIMISFCGIAVASPAEVAKAAENYSVGDVVSVTVIRNGQELCFSVKLTD